MYCHLPVTMGLKPKLFPLVVRRPTHLRHQPILATKRDKIKNLYRNRICNITYKFKCVPDTFCKARKSSVTISTFCCLTMNTKFLVVPILIDS